MDFVKTFTLPFYSKHSTLSKSLSILYQTIIQKHNLPYNGYSVSVIDIHKLDELIYNWVTKMPCIIPYYAMKANPDIEIIKRMSFFDCASYGEMKKVIDLGKDPRSIIFANPSKRPFDIQYAKENKVILLTADSMLEIEKILQMYPECGIVLRIAPKVDNCKTNFSCKFGIETTELLNDCIDKYIDNLRGFSFHIGSGQTDLNAWNNAMRLVDDAFEYIKIHHNKQYEIVDIIDIGGGFSTNVSFELNEVYDTLTTMRKKYHNKIWIAECGRYFCNDVATLLTPIISKSIRKDGTFYVIGNSVYHSFSNIIMDNNKPKQLEEVKDGMGLQYATLVGDSCDGCDILYKGLLPCDMNIGDVLIIPNMGAYSEASTTHFNGFSPSKVEYI